MSTRDRGVRVVTVAERRDRLARRHRLAPSARAADVGAVADSVVALHSSDPVSVYLSATARLATPSLAAVDTALYDDRTVVRHHAMRRTLWVMSPEVARLAHASSTRRIAQTERRRTLQQLADNAVATDVEAWLDDARTQVLGALAQRGQASTRELGDDVPALRSPLELAQGKRWATTVAAHTRVLLLLGFEGSIVRARPLGSWISGQYRWAVLEDWLEGGLGDEDERLAAAALTERWLHAFGPATTADLQWWTGWTATATRRALADVGAVEVALEGGGSGWLAPDDLDVEPPVEPWVAMLPGLDPTTMGWKERGWYLDPADALRLFDGNGNSGPTLWVDGQVIGGWVQRPDGTLARWQRPNLGARRREMDAAAAQLADLVAGTRFTVRFPAPLQRELLG